MIKMNWNGFLKRLPVQVALVFMVLYLATLSGGVTLSSVGLTAKLAGWDPQPMAAQPLFWLLTLPMRCLPAGWIAPALNCFSALCAAITLGLLAASLELAVWDHPLTLLTGWRARLPLLVGAVICGLEFNYWQAATQATGEALQVLLLAAALWNLFQYNKTRKLRWLRRAAFIWGLGLVENWMMLLTLPVFVVWIFWLGKRRLIRLEHLSGLFWAGLAGFSLFALLPTVNGLWPHSTLSLKGEWWAALKNFRGIIHKLYLGFWREHQLATLAALIFYLFTLLPAFIRGGDKETKNISPLDRGQVWFHRAIRAVLLALGLWLAFDPDIGLRQILQAQTGVTQPLLSFDYLLGLGCGYAAGNLLLGTVQSKARLRRKAFMRREAWSTWTMVLLTCLLGLTVAGMFWRNLLAIVRFRSQPFSQFGAQSLRGLPAEGGIVLSDDPLRLLSFQAAAAGSHRSRQWLAINPAWLAQPECRRWLKGRFPGSENINTSPLTLSPVETLNVVDDLARSKRIFYLHSSFGFLFESFYLQPAGGGYELKKYASHELNPPGLSTETITRTEAFWDSAAPQLADLLAACATPSASGIGTRLALGLHILPVTSPQSRLLADWQSRGLTDWGVSLQQAGNLEAARKRFGQALELNPRNTAALINFQINTNLAATHPQDFAALQPLVPDLGSPEQLRRFLMGNGTIDSPDFCNGMGLSFRNGGLPRQAMQQLERAEQLDPKNPLPQIALAGLYAQNGFLEKARQAAAHIRSGWPASTLKTNYLDVDLSLLETGLELGKTNLSGARNLLEALWKEYSGDTRVENRIAGAYLSFGDFDNALRVIGAQLTRTPQDVEKLNVQATVLIQARRAAEALKVLNHALTLTNQPALQFSHARAQFALKDFTAAEKEYHALEKTGLRPAEVSYGLALIAEERHDPEQARRYLLSCLSQCPPDSALGRQVSARLKVLTHANHTPAQ